MQYGLIAYLIGLGADTWKHTGRGAGIGGRMPGGGIYGGATRWVITRIRACGPDPTGSGPISRMPLCHAIRVR